ncbi:putative ABC-type uncharacterized transport system involved in gliding motility auxiliary [Candidatus Moduliflexus flocculans]|uniref:Putative ABC-type uncharacterized transport system involved in gliding motility auxiliary n=1 Tax=Candidatus Moduliflexus flocculans TaxID=1499966 RepID=A0A0S6VU56_9BACT|nr:putative ABC-type uncharacterized transport system involved in gliding motility auxiliary [Candidatus Moduliflexus flocculans]
MNTKTPMQHARTTSFWRSLKYGANTTAMTLIVLGIIVMVEAISARHSYRWDFTSNQRYTLSDQTKNVVSGLASDVTVLAFYSPTEGDRVAFEDRLKQYAALSKHLKYEFVDPDKFPARAQKYEIKTYGTIVLETEKKQEKITDSSEQSLTNGLIKVTRDQKKIIYMIKGHGEHDLADISEKGYSQAKKAMTDQSYDVKDLLLTQQQFIPTDAALVVMAGPQKDLLPAELDLLRNYLDKGGNLLLLLDPDQAPGMTAFVKEYGVILGDDMVIDRMSRMFGAGYETPVVMQYVGHPITDKFNMMTAFPVARSVQTAETLPAGVQADKLFFSSPDSWAETSKAELQSGAVQFDEGTDLRGPVPLAVIAGIATPDQTKKGSKMIVIGDSDFANNTYFAQVGNGDLFLNTVSWLAEEENLIAIRAKDPEIMPLMLTATQGRLAFLISLVVLPVFVIFMGVTMYIQRRAATR